MRLLFFRLILLVPFAASFAFIPSQRKQLFVSARINRKILQRSDGFHHDFDMGEPTRDALVSPQRHKFILSSKVKIDTSDAGSLILTIPRVGVQGSNLFELGFTASWFGIIGYTTLNMVRSGAGPIGTLFLLPFWLAGAEMAKKTVIDPALALQITVGVYAWSLEKRLLGSKTQTFEGPTWELEAAAVNSDMVVNGKALTCIQLRSGSRTFEFGHSLTMKEKEWIVLEINEWLESNEEEIRRAARTIQE